MAITLGVDVSHYQGPINWDAVAKTSYDFALCRMTIGRSTRDDLGHRNLSEMVGRIPISGAYGVVGTSEPVTDGAKFLLDEIAADVDPTKILVMLDAENFSDGSHPTIDQVDRYATAIHDRLGRWPVAYLPAWWMNEHGYTASGRNLANCPWAQSHYLPAPWGETKLQANKPSLQFGFKSLGWLQFTDKATISGISGGVDGNVFYGTLTQLKAQLIGGAPAQEDLSIVDADTKTYLDKQFSDLEAAVLTRINQAVQRVGGRTNSVYNETNADYQNLVMAKDIQQLDATAVAALVAGQLEITAIQTDANGVVTVQFGPKAGA